MTNLRFYDAAYPVTAHIKDVVGVAGYIGGDTPHVWTKEEWDAQGYRYRLPIFVRSDPALADVAGDVAAAVAKLHELGAPKHTAVALDSETAANAAYTAGFSVGLAKADYPIIEYGSLGHLLQNANPDGWYWCADPGAKGMVKGFVGTQNFWGHTYDLDVFEAAWVYQHVWDIKAAPKPAPAVPVNPVPGLVVRGGWDRITVTWKPVRHATGYEVTLRSNGVSGAVLDKVVTKETRYVFKTRLTPRHSLYGVTVRATPSTLPVTVAGANARTR
jgi:hypothetical protein